MRFVLFTVDRLEFVGSGKFIVGGRNCRDVLRLDDRLKLTNVSGSETIEVQVEEITFYGHTVADVAPGMTAGLLFGNDLARHFCLGSELRAEIG